MSEEKVPTLESKSEYPMDLLALDASVTAKIPDINPRMTKGKFFIEESPDGNPVITYVYVEENSKDPIITQEEWEDIIRKKENSKYIPVPDSIKQKFGLEQDIVFCLINGTILPTDRVIYFAKLFPYAKQDTEVLHIGVYNGIKGIKVGSEALGKLIPNFAKCLGAKFITASVNFRNMYFFEKLGYVSASYLDAKFILRCFGEVTKDKDTYKVFFINEDDKNQFLE